MAAASVQNSESAWGAVFSVVSAALLVEVELDDDSEAFVSSSDPPARGEQDDGCGGSESAAAEGEGSAHGTEG